MRLAALHSRPRRDLARDEEELERQQVCERERKRARSFLSLSLSLSLSLPLALTLPPPLPPSISLCAEVLDANQDDSEGDSDGGVEVEVLRPPTPTVVHVTDDDAHVTDEQSTLLEPPVDSDGKPAHVVYDGKQVLRADGRQKPVDSDGKERTGIDGPGRSGGCGGARVAVKEEEEEEAEEEVTRAESRLTQHMRAEPERMVVRFEA
eukprot:1247067-Rhodomonas_salina.1